MEFELKDERLILDSIYNKDIILSIIIENPSTTSVSIYCDKKDSLLEFKIYSDEIYIELLQKCGKINGNQILRDMIYIANELKLGLSLFD